MSLIGKIERAAIVVILIAMALLPAIESIARRFFETSIPGAVLYTQHLTLWLGFLGALLATGQGKHLSLATRELLPEGRWRQGAGLGTGALSAGVCAVLAHASFDVVRADAVGSGLLPLGLPVWVSEMVMPVAFALMAARFVWHASPRLAGKLAALAGAGLVMSLGFAASHAASLVVPGLAVVLLALALGAPVFVAMAGAAMLLFFAEGTPVAAVPAETYRLVASPTLPAIPLLTIAGYILAEGGASRRLLRLARALGGWMPGGMALMVTAVCAAFTTFTGGSGVTILALGGLVLPMLVSERYPEGFGLGLVTSAGSLGLLFPPSLPVILYAVVAQASAEDLYIAGFVPGLLLVLLVALYGVGMGIRAKSPKQPFSGREALGALWQAKWELTIPLLVLVSIVTGYATLVEAAALAVVFAVVSQRLVFKDLAAKGALADVIVRGATLVGAVLILLGLAMGLTGYLVDAEIPAQVLAWTREHIHSPVVFFLALNAVLLVLGSVLEIYSAIIILAPLLVPMAAAYNIDPLHLGVVFLANMELGFLLPPMGLNLILASSRFGQPLARLYKVSLPFLAIRTVGLLLVTFVPQMTSGVLGAVKGKPAPVVAESSIRIDP